MLTRQEDNFAAFVEYRKGPLGKDSAAIRCYQRGALLKVLSP